MAYSTPDALTTGQILNQSSYDKIRDSIIADTHAVFPLGGSRITALPAGGGYLDAADYVEFEVPTTSYTGFVYKVRVEMRTEDAATTVTPKLRNITDSTDAVVGVAATSTAWGSYQELTFVPAAAKKYRLQAVKSDDLFDGWVIGVVVRTHV